MIYHNLRNTHNFILLIFFIIVTSVLFWWFNPPAVPYLMSDSNSYIHFNIERGLGYPLLLKALFFISDEAWWVKSVQLFSILLATAWFSFELMNFFKAPWQAYFILLLIIFNPLVMRYAFTVLTEAFFISFLLMWLSATLRMMVSDKKLWFGIAGLCFAWLVLIKSIALVWLLVALLVFIWLIKQRGWKNVRKNFGLFFLVVSIVFGGDCLYRHTVNTPEKSDSYLGRQLLGKTAFIYANPKKTDYPLATAYLNEIMSDVRKGRELLPDYRQQFIFSLNFYDYIRFQNYNAILSKINLTDSTQDKSTQFAISVIRSNWGGYIEEVVRTMVAIWSFGDKQTHSFATTYNQQLECLSKYIPKTINLYQMTGDISLFKISGHSPLVVYGIRIFMGIAFLVSLFSVLKFIISWSSSCYKEQDYFLFILSVAVHSYIVGVSLFQTALPRYIVVIFPLLFVLVFIGYKELTLFKFSRIDIGNTKNNV